MRITVMGTGAVGGFYGGRLAAAGHEVLFVARGENLEALRMRGLVIDSPEGRIKLDVRASDRPEDAEYILFTVKAYGAEAAARACSGVKGHILTLLNGVGPEEILLPILGDRVVGGVAYVGAALSEPGVIHHEAGGWIVAGEFDGRATPRLSALKEAFERARLRCDVTDQIRRAMWEKLSNNIVINVMSVAHGVELGAFVSGPLREEAERVMDETAAVARAHGIEIRSEGRPHLFGFCAMFPAFKTSTQQDVTRGRPTEIEFLTGAVLRHAVAKGLSAPATAEIHQRARSKADRASR